MCEYDLEPGVSRSKSMRHRNDALQAEVDRLRELLTHDRRTLTTKPQGDYQQLRQPAVVKDVTTIPEDGNFSSRPCPTGVRNETLAFDLEDLDVAAMSESNFRVRARPWTAIADDGLVSELLSSFFASDGCFYLSFIDQQYFLEDMEAGNIDMAEFCSPLLVNAMCALRCVSKYRIIQDGTVNISSSQPPATPECLARYRASMPQIAFLRRPGTC
jgi:hypothetical protein